MHGGRLLGKFMLYHDEPHDWSDAEVLLCRNIASHLASATVRTEAQEALRASSDQLATIMRTVDEGLVMQSQTGRSSTRTKRLRASSASRPTAEFLAATATRVLAQFEILDEDRTR